MTLVIIGPTASGKSAVAMHLAQIVNGEIVNADSRQIYKHLDEGTSKPSLEDRKKIPHHLYDFLEPSQMYNAGEYARSARKTIEGILARKKVPIVTGGTGLYLKSLFVGLAELPGRDEAIRKKLLAIAENRGRKALHEALEKADPASAKNIPYQNIQRVVRALEVYEITGKPLSAHHEESRAKKANLAPKQFGILWKRDDLKNRIRERTAKIAPGIIKETEKLEALGYRLTDPGCQSLGYKQAFLYLQKKMTREEFESALLTETYRYAKRQMTWFGKDKSIHWMEPGPEFDPEKVAIEISRMIPTRPPANK